MKEIYVTATLQVLVKLTYNYISHDAQSISIQKPIHATTTHAEADTVIYALRLLKEFEEDVIRDDHK